MERAQHKVYANPRSDLKLGCNFFRFQSPSERYAKFFANAFDFASLPFYTGNTVHQGPDCMEQFYTIASAREEIQALTWWDFIEPSFSGNGAFLYEDENPREMYFRLLALKERIIQRYSIIILRWNACYPSACSTENSKTRTMYA